MTLGYFLILFFLIASAVLYWPELVKDDGLRKLRSIKSMIPGEFMKRMFQGVMDSGFPAYVAVQHFFKGINIAGIACAVLIGTGAISGERENGTIETLLSRPVSRARILFQKWWVLVLCCTTPIFLCSMMIPWMESWIPAETIQSRCDFAGLMHASWRGSLFVVIFLTMTMLFSVLFRSQVQVAFAIGAAIVAQVGMFFVQVLRGASVFRLSDYDVYWPIMAGNRHFWRMFWTEDIWLILGIALLYALTWWRFRRMDL